jgi:methylmalonyl-CoA/ethylmalonyl-CoA epimerase
MNTEVLATKLGLGQMAQVGFVVHDLSKAVEIYEQTVGIGPFAIIDFIPEKSYIKGRAGRIELKIGIAQLTPALSIELIQVIDGEPYHKDFLREHGQGVQHLGFVTNEYDQVLERAGALGIEVLMWAQTDVPGMGHVRGAYLDTYALMGVLVEIIEIKPFD